VIGGEHGAVVVRLEFDRIGPRSLRILLTRPLAQLLAAAVHRQLALTVTAAHRQMAAAALAGLEDAALEASSRHLMLNVRAREKRPSARDQ
jgi:hypothetical protein